MFMACAPPPGVTSTTLNALALTNNICGGIEESRTKRLLPRSTEGILQGWAERLVMFIEGEGSRTSATWSDFSGHPCVGRTKVPEGAYKVQSYIREGRRSHSKEHGSERRRALAFTLNRSRWGGVPPLIAEDWAVIL